MSRFLPRIHARNNKQGISDTLRELINRRGVAIRQLKIAEAMELDGEIRRMKRNERREAVLNSISKELDLRDRWAGIRALKRP